MPKTIRENQDIYIAPKILGTKKNGQPIAIDEKNENLELDPTTIDNKIIIYERQVKGWFLNRATNYLRGNDNGFIILMICMSYLEGAEQYRQGRSSNGRSRKIFVQALQKLYPNEYSKNNLALLYTESRCGLFHNGMVGGKIIIKDSYPSALKFRGTDIEISPKKLLADIKDDFKEYIEDLKNEDNINLRNNFDKMFSIMPQN